MISRTGEREELPRSPRGPCPPSALPLLHPSLTGWRVLLYIQQMGPYARKLSMGNLPPSAFWRWSWCLALLMIEHLLLARHRLLCRPRHQLHFIVYGEKPGSGRLHFLASTTQHRCNTSRFGSQVSKIPKPWVSTRLMILSNGGRSPFPSHGPGAKGHEVQKGHGVAVTGVEQSLSGPG